MIKESIIIKLDMESSKGFVKKQEETATDICDIIQDGLGHPLDFSIKAELISYSVVTIEKEPEVEDTANAIVTIYGTNIACLADSDMKQVKLFPRTDQQRELLDTLSKDTVAFSKTEYFSHVKRSYKINYRDKNIDLLGCFVLAYLDDDKNVAGYVLHIDKIRMSKT